MRENIRVRVYPSSVNWILHEYVWNNFPNDVSETIKISALELNVSVLNLQAYIRIIEGQVDQNMVEYVYAFEFVDRSIDLDQVIIDCIAFIVDNWWFVDS